MRNDLLIRWQKKIFILCWMAYSFAYFCRVNFSVALPAIQDTYKWSNAKIGLIGSSLFWVYALGQLINGYIGDKIDSRKFVFIGLIASAAINIAFGFANSLPLMVILWGINGFFQSMLWGPIIKTLSNWFSHKQKNRVAVLISTTMVSGYLIAWAFSGLILNYKSWRWVFYIPGLVVTAFSIVWYIGMRSHPEEVGLTILDNAENSELEANGTNGEYLSLWQLIIKTKLIPVAIACVAQGIIKDSITLWSPKFLMETQNMSMDSTIGLVIIIPIANFIGIMFAGWLNKRLNNNEKFTSIVLYSAGFIACLGLFVFSEINIFISMICLYLSSALMAGANTLLISIVPLRYSKYNKVSSVAGFLDFCCYVGSGITGIMTGFLVDNVGWNGVLMSWIVVSIIGVISISLAWISDKKQVSMDIMA